MDDPNLTPKPLSPAEQARRGSTYQHRRSGAIYRVRTLASDMDLNHVVVYENVITGVVWVRRAAEFNDGRFKFIHSTPPTPVETKR